MTANPEQAVLDAIAGLEQDEIGELVRWQLEEGVRRGDGPDDGCDDEGYIPGGLVGCRPREPRPVPMRPPSGPWWRCDDPANLTVNITQTAHVGSHATRWEVRVGEQVVVDCMIEWGSDIPAPVDFELDESSPPWGRKARWMAVRCETKPEAGEWRLWERAALVPVGLSLSGERGEKP
ncbi:hypothetical protein [Nocardia sp. NPDC004260]